MKSKFCYLVALVVMMVMTACSSDEPSTGLQGSPRDWTYTGEQVEFYINGVTASTFRIREPILSSFQKISEKSESSHPISWLGMHR